MAISTPKTTRVSHYARTVSYKGIGQFEKLPAESADWKLITSIRVEIQDFCLELRANVWHVQTLATLRGQTVHSLHSLHSLCILSTFL